MPKLEVQKVATRSIGGGLTEVTATVANSRIIPTHSEWDVKNRINPPDYISLSGGKVLAGSIVVNRNLGLADDQRIHPERIEVASIPGQSFVTLRWIVSGSGPFTVTVESQKGGRATGRNS
jgi:hypothetical protein